MKKILVINGANLNMLGVREKEIYGEKTYKDLVSFIKTAAGNKNLKVRVCQTNHEGKIVDMIQHARRRYDGIIINAGGYTHTSVSVADAIKAVSLPTVEVHLSNIYAREEFRKVSYITPVAEKTIVGKGFAGYADALDFFADNACRA